MAAGSVNVVSLAGLVAAAALFSQPTSQDPERGWGFIGGIPVLPERDTQEYFNLLRTDYKFRLQPDYVQYSVDIKVDPCRDLVLTGGRGDQCCFDMNTVCCQHHPLVQAGPDLQIAFFQNAHIPNCHGTLFAGDLNCGTYIEVHRKGSIQVLADISIDAEPFTNGYRTTRVATHKLCLGEHELWWVVRTRSGPWVQQIVAFNVSFPTCAASEGSIASPKERVD